MNCKKWSFILMITSICIWSCDKVGSKSEPVSTYNSILQCTKTNRYNYETDIQPLLISHCSDQGCHNAATPQAGLNVHSYTSVKNTVLKESSKFIKRIKHEVGAYPMPPLTSKKEALNNEQIMMTICWIETGMSKI
ncbi:MAG: hypothetical protein ACJAUV_001353 [Flavobacteriales bacterium]|jgi:hypothetical protein